MHKGSEQVFCRSHLSPRVPELTGRRKSVKALCYIRKRPRPTETTHGRPCKLQGEGSRCSSLRRPSRGEKGAGGAAQGPRSHSRVAKEPGGQVQAPAEEAPRRGGWRLPSARTAHRTLGRGLTWRLPNRHAREQNSGYDPPTSTAPCRLSPLTRRRTPGGTSGRRGQGEGREKRGGSRSNQRAEVMYPPRGRAPSARKWAPSPWQRRRLGGRPGAAGIPRPLGGWRQRPWLLGL